MGKLATRLALLLALFLAILAVGCVVQSDQDSLSREDYIEELTFQLLFMGDSQIVVAGLLLYNPNAPTDFDRKDAIKRELRIWSDVRQELINLKPSDGLQLPHNMILEAMEVFDGASTDLTTWLEAEELNFDSEVLSEALGKMDRGGELIVEAIELFEEFEGGIPRVRRAPSLLLERRWGHVFSEAFL